MEKQLFQEIPENKRAAYLQDNADTVEKLGYLRKFTPDEITEKKNQLSTIAIEIDDLEEEKKSVTAVFKTKLAPLNDSRKSLLKNIRMKAEHITENCFKFINQSDREVGYYNANGDLVESRKMLPEERQKGLFSLNTAAINGTNDNNH